MFYFATNFQPTANVTKNSILHVARVLDIPLVELSVCTFNMFTSIVFQVSCWQKKKLPLEML